MIDPVTGQEIPDFITPQAPISPIVPGAGPLVVPPVNRFPMQPPAPDVVTPDSLITAPLPSTTGGVLPPPTPVGDVGPVPGLASTQPVAPPITGVPSALPAGGGEPGTAVPATAHTPAFTGPATSTPPVNDQSVGDIQKASGEVQQATQDLGAAQAQAAADEATAREHQVEQDQLNIDRHRETARQVQEDIQRINDHQRSAVEESHKTTIPDFWEGREGAHALGAISMALGTAGQALTAFGTGVNVGNTAKDLIDANIRTYMARKKEEVDNLWKYADRMGQLGQQEKADLGQKLVNLQYETAAMHQSAADEIMAQATAAKGRVAIPQAMELAKQQALTGAQLANEARQKNAQLQLEKRRVGIEGYNAASGRMRALDDRQNQLNIKIDERTVRDTNGTPIGLAPSSRVVTKLADDLAAKDKYLKLIDEVAADIESKGRILNPYSEEAKKRKSNLAELQALGRQLSKIQASDAGQKLEHEMIGASGIGTDFNMLNPGTLRQLGKTAADQVNGRLMSQLSPMPGQQKVTIPQSQQSTEKMVTVRNGKTGETKQVTEAEARQMGAL